MVVTLLAKLLLLGLYLELPLPFARGSAPAASLTTGYAAVGSPYR